MFQRLTLQSFACHSFLSDYFNFVSGNNKTIFFFWLSYCSERLHTRTQQKKTVNHYYLMTQPKQTEIHSKILSNSKGMSVL